MSDLDPQSALDQLGALWSPDFDAYASGELPASAVRCVLCQHAPCDCPPFGSAAYFELLDARHGRPARPAAPSCSAPECPLTAQLGAHPRGLALSGRSGPDHLGRAAVTSAACTTEPGHDADRTAR